MFKFNKKQFVIAIALTVFGFSLHGLVHAGQNDHGPLSCSACQLPGHSPQDDSSAQAWSPLVVSSQIFSVPLSIFIEVNFFLHPPLRAPPVSVA